MPSDSSNSSVPWEASLDENMTPGGTQLKVYQSELNETSGTLWIQYRLPTVDESGSRNLGSKSIETIYCEGYNVSLTTQHRYLNGEHVRPALLNIEYLNAVGPVGSLSGYRLSGRSGEEFAVHGSFLQAVASIFAGGITSDQRQGAQYDTTITDIPAFVRDKKIGDASRDTILQDDLILLVEEFSLNYTLTLLAFPDLQQSVTVPAMCDSTITQQVWKYEPLNLFISYGSGAIAAIFAMIIGAMAVVQNRTVAGNGFKEILCTTRNKELDEIARGNCLGASGKELNQLGKIKLRFGVLKQDDVTRSEAKDVQSAEYVAFGLVSNVTMVKRNGNYT